MGLGFRVGVRVRLRVRVRVRVRVGLERADGDDLVDGALVRARVKG